MENEIESPDIGQVLDEIGFGELAGIFVGKLIT